MSVLEGCLETIDVIDILTDAVVVVVEVDVTMRPLGIPGTAHQSEPNIGSS